MANATLTVHAAGWLEGGLSFGYEKFINDIEALQNHGRVVCETSPALMQKSDSTPWPRSNPVAISLRHNTRWSVINPPFMPRL